MIAKREGYGNVLADGSLKAAKTIGDEAEKYIFQVKGMELASCGVRASKGESLSHLISINSWTPLSEFPLSLLVKLTNEPFLYKTDILKLCLLFSAHCIVIETGSSFIQKFARSNQ